MEHVKKIIVSIQFSKNVIELGELVSEGPNIYFKYYTDFIKKGIEISPIKLKLNTIINKADTIPFDGLFGVFADSLPDGWGKLLLDRALTARGMDISNMTMLDRLAFVGSKGMGALIYKPEIDDEIHKEFEFELDKIAKATHQIISGTSTEILDELYILGGSSGGARPKILVGYNPKTQHIIGTESDLPIGYEHWIIKFPSSSDSTDIANIEYAYYKMALDAGIEMSECKLFKGKSGQVYFGTKRFDRIGNNRLHMHSAAGIMHDNFRLSNLDYGHIMDCAFKLEKDIRAYEKILRLAAFNVFAHNRDDHSKNFSFLMEANGNWKVAPAYDLTFSSSGHGMHSTMVSGESANPTKKNLIELANYFKIKNASKIIDQVQTVIYNWKDYAKQCKVSNDSKNRIQKVIGK
ncbi:MAG: type II toxin-antitoxin system HipA family toxin [Bacteroidia bacterium]|jgi:serine/threonine-protein kinase HipA|nr:type II toxin-antitoxin system HipA family toxin [Bacteroidia bacterium]